MELHVDICNVYLTGSKGIPDVWDNIQLIDMARFYARVFLSKGYDCHF